MSQNLEIEKKFIIEYPDLDRVMSMPECSHTDIEQIYLLGCDGKSERIRKRGRDNEFKYYHTVKYHVTAMTRVEEERVISEEEYTELSKRADSSLKIIYKTRYCFPYEGHDIEIDVFPFWKNQAYLEIELDSENEEFAIPDFIKCVKDVTLEPMYTNRALAQQIPPEIL